MNAFENNGIDYLLKPFLKDRFQKAWDKFLLLRKSPSLENELLANLTLLIEKTSRRNLIKSDLRYTCDKELFFLILIIPHFLKPMKVLSMLLTYLAKNIYQVNQL